MKKLLSLLLTLALVLPMFLVYSFASVNDLALRQQGIDRGFESLINIDEYISNAGNPGYQDFSLLSVNTEIEKTEFNTEVVKFTLYFYNPGTIDLEVSSGELNNIVSLGTVSYVNNLTDDQYNSSLYMDISSDELEDVHILEDQMFIKAYFYAAFDGNYTLTYFLNSINWTNGSNTVFNINQNFGVFDYEASIDESSPFMDLSFIMNETVDSIKELYPIDEDAEFEDCRLLFAYEADEYLYIYLYYPRGESITFSSNFIYNFNSLSYESHNFGLVSSEAPLFKLKFDVSDLGILNEDVRDYYILSDTTIVSFSNSSNSSNNSASFKPSYKAHYTFSNSSLEGVDSPSFKYQTSFKATDFYSNYKYQLLLTSDVFTPDTVSFITNWPDYTDDLLNVVGPLNNIFLVKNEKNLIEFIPFVNFPEVEFTFQFSTDFPLKDTVKYYPKFFLKSFNSTSTLSETSMDTLDPFVSDYTNNLLLDIIYPSSNNSYKLFDNKSDDKDLYMRVNQEEQIYIKPNYTYYRINNSINGNNKYQTLSSIYFTVPGKYLELNDLNDFNNRYISQIELVYSSAMTAPLIFVSDENIYDYLLSYKGEDVEFYIMDKDAVFHNYSNENSSYYVETDLLIGKNPSFNYGIVTGTYYAQKYFDKYFYVFYVPGDYEPMEEVFSSESLLNFINRELHLVSGLENEHYILDFDDELTLSSFKDASFWDKANSIGFLNAFFFENCGSTQILDDTKKFSAISTYSGSELVTLSLMTDENLSSTLGANINDISDIRKKLNSAFLKNEAFVMVRYDVFDYYTEYCHIYDSKFSVEQQAGSFYAQTKYYQGIDVLNLAVSNNIDTLVYSVFCDPIDAISGITYPDPIDPDKILKPSNPDFWNNNNPLWEQIMQLVSLIFGIIMIVLLWPVVSFIINIVIDIKKWFKKIFKKKE